MFYTEQLCFAQWFPGGEPEVCRCAPSFGHLGTIGFVLHDWSQRRPCLPAANWLCFARSAPEGFPPPSAGPRPFPDMPVQLALFCTIASSDGLACPAVQLALFGANRHPRNPQYTEDEAKPAIAPKPVLSEVEGTQRAPRIPVFAVLCPLSFVIPQFTCSLSSARLSSWSPNLKSSHMLG